MLTLYYVIPIHRFLHLYISYLFVDSLKSSYTYLTSTPHPQNSPSLPVIDAMLRVRRGAGGARDLRPRGRGAVRSRALRRGARRARHRRAYC